MDSARFDDLTRLLGHIASRRTTLLGLAATTLIAPLAGLGGEESAAKKKHRKKKRKKKRRNASNSPPPPPPPPPPASCPSGQTLCNGSCIADALCCDDADCGSGQRCLGNGSCAFDCTDDILSCPGSAEGTCACFTEVDGFKNCGVTNLFCEDQPETCGVDADCEPGFHCIECGAVNKCMPLCDVT